MDTSDRTIGQVVLQGILETENLTINQLGTSLGMGRAQSLYDIDSGKTKNITKKMADKIQAAFPSYSLSWLMSGEGEMLSSSRPVALDAEPVEEEEAEEADLLPRITESEGRPYYDMDFLGGFGEFLDDPSSVPVAYMIDYPPYNREGVFYVNVLGNSMAPEFNSGDVIALRAIEAWHDFLLLGKVYAIVTRSGQRTVKRLRKGSDREHYLLEATNPDYESQEIPLSQIERVFEVLGGIRRYE